MASQNARLYIGGYMGTSPTEKLEEIFGKYGKILEIKRNRNFSFLQYADEGSAQAAINNEHQKNYFGKTIDVQIAKQSRGTALERGEDKDSDGRLGSNFSSVFGGGFDKIREDGMRDGSPGFRTRPGEPPKDRFDGPPFGGFDRHSGPPGPGFNGSGRGGPFSGPPRGPPPGRGYDDGPGYRDREGPNFGPPGGRGYGGPPPRDFGPPEHPPTQPPGPLHVSHENRTNDVEIIVINKAITDYGEFIEQKLKSLAFTVDLLFPNEEVPLRRVLANIASRGTLYAVLVTPQHREKRSLTLNVLHGAPQEHRNMLVEDAVTLISRNYEMYVMQTSEKKPEFPPEDIRNLMQQALLGKHLTVPQIDKLTGYLYQQKQKAEREGPNQPPMIPNPQSGPPPPKGTSVQEAELQNRILNILNKGGSGPPPPMSMPPNPVAAKPPLLNDPSVQKALDNLIQGFNPNNRMRR